ncbi:MAG: prephenate dehydratase [Bacillota bacterium]
MKQAKASAKQAKTSASRAAPGRPASARPVAYQGEPGANSEDAVAICFGETAMLPCRTLSDAFAAVQSGRARAAVVPVENSTAGSIVETYDLLRSSGLVVAGELLLPVDHCLVALPGQTLADIAQVHSHPQALAQCDTFLREHRLEPVAATDTAGSARMLKERGLRGAAAIASRRAAVLYGLDVLAEKIQAARNNITRFFVIARKPAPRGPRNKTAIVIATPNRPGALYWCLGALACRSINLTKLEARPSRERPWEYVFYAEFEGHADDPEIDSALRDLATKSSEVRVLGSFPAAAEIPSEKSRPTKKSVQRKRNTGSRRE